MGEEEIILTNTYLNSKKRNILAENQRKKPLSKKGNISWKNDLIIEHSYCPNSIIAVNNPYLQSKKVNNTHPVRDRSDSAASKE